MENNLRLTNDLEAEKVLLDFKTYREDKERLIATCNEVIKEYKDKIEQFESELKFKKEFIEFNLQAYMETVPTKTTKTQLSYQLPSAKLVYKVATTVFEKDESKLIDTVDEKYIKTTLKLDWASYKKQLKQLGDKVVDVETGEVVEGVELKQKDGEFQIKY